MSDDLVGKSLSLKHTWHVTIVQEPLFNVGLTHGVHSGQAGRGFYFLYCTRQDKVVGTQEKLTMVTEITWIGQK